MSEIGNIRKRSNAFVRDLEFYVSQAIESNSDDIVQLNRDQMLRGKLKTGEAIKPKYSSRYAKKKGFSTPNLKLKGDFQDEMDLIVNESSEEVIITSFDYKNPFLINRYTDKIFGIPTDKQKRASGWVQSSLARLWNKIVLNA